jgi:prepilin-type processing-associated H-X9-DG protein
MRTLGASKTRAFTVLELVVVIGTLAIFILLIMPALMPVTTPATRINCVLQLKQAGVAFRVWAADHEKQYPMQTFPQGDVVAPFQVFRAMSNDLKSPKLLVCPADLRRKHASAFAADFNNDNVSYFIGLDAEPGRAAMFLCGDRNLTNGAAPRKGLLELSTNQPPGWTTEMHYRRGNVALVDGSVQQCNEWRLRQLLRATGTNITRLAMP